MLYLARKLLKINMLTQFFQSINWIDVVLALLFIIQVFISVKTGFVAEGFKFIGTLCALFVSLHYYAFLAGFFAKKINLPLATWQLIVFISIAVLISLAFMFFYKGVLLLFKIEANHQAVDKYAAGSLGAARAIFLCSLTIFGLLLVKNDWIQKQTNNSWGYRLVGKAAPNTYAFAFNNVIGKIFDGQKINSDVFAVVGSHGTHPK